MDHTVCRESAFHPRMPPNVANPRPAIASAARTVRGPAARRATATMHESIVTHVSEPSATPATNGAGAADVAVEAAPKIAAQDTIVDGFDAVAATAVTN